ncbi:response regulator [Arthrobacter sp. CAU 1506]|uniref:response regulator n=1 Tax=Arthrobacter sp. CAU 1506 TaxID=2560052 RepID=UPI0010ABA8B2|nr:response regulator [Arthrobacter sp. CAU 1506]TJY72217.1 response regulator [Arthrobacter sp. CAU 1506]
MNQIRTVVVDDDKEVAGVHTGFLLAHGSFDAVGTAYTGADGLAMISSLRPELVLLDIHLPDLSGIEVLRAVRNLPGEPVDVIAITAARELDTVRAAMAGGVLHYLVKPFTARVLMDRLDAYVEHRRHISGSGQAAVLDQDGIDRLLAPARNAGSTSARETADAGGSGQASGQPAEPTAGPPRPAAAAGGRHRTGAPLAAFPGSRAQVPLPKGLSLPTLEAVIADLNAIGAASSASEVAGRLGLARVSARRYLEYLVSRGEARITPRYGTAGRPEKFYLLTGS